MVQLKNVIPFLDAKTASRAATANRATRNASRRRMNSPNAQKEKNNAEFFKNLYQNLLVANMANWASMYRNNGNEFIKIYGKKTTGTNKYNNLLRKAQEYKNKKKLMNEIIMRHGA